MLRLASIAFAAVLVVVFFLFDTAISEILTDIGRTLADALGAHSPEIMLSAATAVVQPLAVKSSDAWTMLGISHTHGYKLIADGEIDSYLEGRIRKVTVASIKAYIERKLAAEKNNKHPARTAKATAVSLERREAMREASMKPPNPACRPNPSPALPCTAASPAQPPASAPSATSTGEVA